MIRRLVLDVGSWFVQKHTHILDIGCSHGDGLEPFINRFGAGNQYVALDESQPMVDACKNKLSDWIDNKLLDVRLHDLRNGLPPLTPSLILSTLTLQFVPVEHRQRIVADAYRILKPGGALILAEKTLGNDAAADKLLVETYLNLKRQHGYSEDDIQAKRKALQGVLVPQTAEANVRMLQMEGFRVQEFWRALNFVGWIAVKPKAGA